MAEEAARLSSFKINIIDKSLPKFLLNCQFKEQIFFFSILRVTAVDGVSEKTQTFSDRNGNRSKSPNFFLKKARRLVIFNHYYELKDIT